MLIRVYFCFAGLKVNIKNYDLFEKWVSSAKSEAAKAVADHIKLVLHLTDISDGVNKEIEKVSYFFCLRADAKWRACCRNRAYFLKRHKQWLESEITLPARVIASKNEAEKMDTSDVPSTSRGRPRKAFDCSSLKTKKRRVQKLVDNYSFEELSFAANLVAHNSPEKLNKQPSLTDQQLIALYLDLDLSERKYIVLRDTVNSVHPDLLPSLYQLRKIKKQFYEADIKCTEISAKICLQELLNKTAESIIKDKLNEISGCLTATLTCKWGLDGSGGHSTYKQKFLDSTHSDEYLFLIALSPLNLVDSKTTIKIWENPRPASTHYCRPIKFIFSKENKNLIKYEEAEIQGQISNLETYVIFINGHEIEINFSILFTMLDGSVCNTLTETNASSRCFICGATPKEMNNETIVSQKTPKVENFRFGLSPLHLWIRCFECLLHIAYKLPFKSWQLRGDENKKALEERKKDLQTKFKQTMGLLVDKPKPGYGSTNDGNTAKRFFYNPEISSEITGVDVTLIKHFSIILRILASGRIININKFSVLLQDTKKLYLSLYGWYYMPSSIHKLLIHGTDIISFFELPIGQLTEEALEACHKVIRKNRLTHTRKTSRLSSNKDLFLYLLLNSDPLISSQRKIISRKPTTFDKEIEEYFEMDISTTYPLPEVSDFGSLSEDTLSDSD